MSTGSYRCADGLEGAIGMRTTFWNLCWTTGLVCALGLGCQVDGPERSVAQFAVVAPSGPAAVAEAAEPPVGSAPRKPAVHSETSEPAAMPPALRRSFVAATMANVGPEYAVRTETDAGHAVLVTQHPRQGLRAEFGAGAVRLGGVRGDEEARIARKAAKPLGDDGEDGWHVELSLAGVGRGSALDLVGEAAPQATGNRVEYRRDGLTEWYLHGPLGLEQGFTLERRPEGEGSLVVGVALSGVLVPALSADGSKVELCDEVGAVRVVYRDLSAWDADGTELSARLELSGRVARLVVDDAAARYPVVIDPLIAVQEAKLLASDGATGDDFGSSVAISGDTALVGARYDDDLGSNSGSAYVFVRSGGTWTQQQKLTAADGAADDDFGLSVAISGDTALVGARYDDDLGSNSGSAYVFVRFGGVWTQQQKLTASDGSAGGMFGYSVSVSGDTVLVGAVMAFNGTVQEGGACYVFVRSGGVWTQQQKLTASDGAGSDNFGVSVSLSGDTALVGARLDDDLGDASGSAYVFVRFGGVWTQQQKLTASDGIAADHFGQSVSLSGDTALVGALYWGLLSDQTGSAYVFARSGGTWTQQQVLQPADGAGGDRFGVSVSLYDDTALVGSYFDDDLGSNSGSAYVFVRFGGTWTQQLKLTALDGSGADNFGHSVSISGDTALAGSHFDDDLGSQSGSAYVFRILPVGGACSVPGDCATGFCVDGVCCNLACGGGLSNDCMACSTAAGGGSNGICGPLTAVAAPTITCRASAGSCDVAESCTGGSASCPADGFVASGTSCRVSAGICDVAESCTGSSTSCPVNAFLPVGTACNDGLWCVDGTTCTGSSETCTGGAPHDCSDGLACTTDTCNESTDACEHTIVAGGCRIGSACIADGAINPADPCEACDSAVSTTGWTPRATGASCDDDLYCTTGTTCDASGACGAGTPRDCSDGRTCTTDTCDETADRCTSALASGCLIGGACVADATPNPANACEACLPATASDGYSPTAVGTACDDGQYCTTGDACDGASACVGAARDCSDGLGCTTDICDDAADACTSALASGCLIGGACFAAGETNPSGPCESCQTSVSSSAWTPAPAGTACDDGSICTTGDACNAGGLCIGTGSACDDGLDCTSDTCDETSGGCGAIVEADSCVVEFACVARDTEDPTNPCLACLPAVATDAYSPRPADDRCGDPSCVDGMFTPAATCDGAGVCVDGTPEACVPFVCADPISCSGTCTSDDECLETSYCTAEGDCADDMPDGDVCDRDEMCGSGFCADGVCCDDSCGGTCEFCDAEGEEGSCTAYALGEDPEDECAGDDFCNGEGDCIPVAADADADADADGDADADADGDADADADADADVIGDTIGDEGADGDETPTDESGCGCRTTGRMSGGLAGLLLGLLAATLVVFRRRRS